MAETKSEAEVAEPSLDEEKTQNAEPISDISSQGTGDENTVSHIEDDQNTIELPAAGSQHSAKSAPNPEIRKFASSRTFSFDEREFKSGDQDTGTLESTPTTSTEEDIDDNDLTNTILCCLCCMVILLLIAGYIMNRAHPFEDTFSPSIGETANMNVNEYPECNHTCFLSHINSLRTKKGNDKNKSDIDIGYHSITDPRIAQNISDLIEKQEQNKVILLYGAIEYQIGTIALFDEVETRLNTNHFNDVTIKTSKTKKSKNMEEIKTWIYDPNTFHHGQCNGTSWQRIRCLFMRADQWSTDNPQSTLLVVLDHLSRSFRGKNAVSLHHEVDLIDKRYPNRKWIVFVVESSPYKNETEELKNMVVARTGSSAVIHIPFTGGYFLEQIMRTLTESNPDIIQMVYPNLVEKNKSWVVIKEETRAFTMRDTFNLYHHVIEPKVKEMAERNGHPVKLEFNEFRRMVKGFRTSFDNETRQRMEAIAGLFTSNWELKSTPLIQGGGRGVSGNSSSSKTNIDGQKDDDVKQTGSKWKSAVLYVTFTLGIIAVAFFLVYAFAM